VNRAALRDSNLPGAAAGCESNLHGTTGFSVVEEVESAQDKREGPQSGRVREGEREGASGV
jgi:hypothetical protein